jgi:uncharacterized RDD family membrane protein YckC
MPGHTRELKNGEMTQQEDVTSQEPDTGQTGAGGQPASGPGQPSQDPAGADHGPGVAAAESQAPADSIQSAASQEPVWPSPYLSEGAAIPEAYPAPPQPGQPRYGQPGGPVPPGQSFSPGQQGYPRPGYGQPGNGQPGYQPAYGQPGYGQSGQSPRRPMGRLGPGGQVTSRDPALAAAWERLLAMTIDWILILVAAFLAVLSPMLKVWSQLHAVILNSQTSSQTATQTAINNVLQSPATTSALIRFWVIAFAIGLAYFWALSAVWGGTVGKLILGLRVVEAGNRSRVSIRAAGVRAVAFLAGPAILLLVPDVGLLGGLIWVADCTVILLDSRMQCLHDRAANTVVIRKRWLDQQARPTQASPW